jgi:hypothetical protein
VKWTARIERASPGWRPGALPVELRPRVKEEPPAGVEPALQPYEGCVLPLTPQKPGVETAGVEPAFPRCKRGARPLSYVPDEECERVESNHHSAGRRLYRPRSSPVLSVRMAARRATDRIRTGTCRAHTPGCSRYTTVTTTRTTGLEPAASRWTAERSARLSYVRKERRWDSNPRSRAHEARGDSPPPLRICPAGVEPAVVGSRNRRGSRLPYRQSYPRRESNPRLPG